MKTISIFILSLLAMVFVLMYRNYPYLYAFTYSAFLIFIGILLLDAAMSTKRYDPYMYSVWYLYIVVCNIILMNYVPRTSENIITIWVTSLGVYILSMYFIKHITKYIGIPIYELTRWSFVSVYSALVLYITLIYLGIWHLFKNYGLYGAWAANTIVIAVLEYIDTPNRPISLYTLVRLIATSLVCMYVLYYIYNAYKNQSKGVLFETYPVIVGPYKTILTKTQFNELRKHKYKYSIQFDLQIIPQSENSMEASLIKIDDVIDIKYNSITSVLSIHVLQNGQKEYTIIYDSHYSPKQIWNTYILNILDGKLDVFIDNRLKISERVILGETSNTIGLSIGDKYNRTNKGYVRRIIVRDDIYIPPPLI
jgi:hypothetical protein